MERDNYPNLVASSATISRAFSLFETIRRRACAHVGWDYEIPLPNQATRTQGSIWAVLSSDCRQCHEGYVGLPKTSYLMWKGYLPVKCAHGGVIVDMLVDPDRQPGSGGLVVMPLTVEPVNPPGASVSSGGETTSTKLREYLQKVETRSKDAMDQIMAFLNVAEHSPAPGYFPELQVDWLRDRLALVEDRAEGLKTALQTQLEARLIIEQDLETTPVPPTLEQSTPQRTEQQVGGSGGNRRHSSTRNLLDDEVPAHVQDEVLP